MITTIILFIISVLLEVVVPNVLRNITPFFVICVIAVASANVNNKNAFYLSSFIFGVIYDLTYTNTVFLHGFIYLFLSWLSLTFLAKKGNFIKTFLCYFILIITYLLIVILFTVFYNSYNMYDVVHILYDGLIINVIYFLIVYLTYNVTNYVFKNRFKKSSY